MVDDKEHCTLQALRTAIAVIDNKLAEREKALRIQASEYERRLDALNHSFQEARTVQQTYVPREVYERAHDVLVQWRSRVDDELATTRGRNSTLISVISIVLALAAVIVSGWRVIHG